MVEHPAVNRRVTGSSPVCGAKEPLPTLVGIFFMGYSVYILASQKAKKYYIGQSADALRRLEYHNTIEKGYTIRYRPWKIVYNRECTTRQEAREIERKIKKWKSRIMIEKLIRGEMTI